MLYELLSVIKQLYQILIVLDGWQMWPIIMIVLTREKKMPDKRGVYLMKVVFLIITIVLICYLLFRAFGGNNKEKCDVMIVEDKSFLSGFEVKDNEVHIYCEISLKNNSNETKKVKLMGDFQQELENGLLKESNLEAYFIEKASNSVEVEGKSNINYMKVEFVGEYAGYSRMSNRMLPDIDVIEIME